MWGEQVTAEILPKHSCWYGFNPREQTEMIDAAQQAGAVSEWGTGENS
jgi:hypothetical protein